MKKILFINPVGCDILDKETEDYLKQYKEDDTDVFVESLDSGLPWHLEQSYLEVLIAEKLLHRIKRAELEGYDACVIGCYYDPFLEEAREICEKMIVTAPAEAAMHIGTTLASSFSVLVVRRKTIPEMKDNVYHHGYQKYLASFRSLEIGVRQLQVDPEYTKQRMREEIKKAIDEDGAEAILLGCTVQLGFFDELQKEFHVPIIDANIAPLKYAEFLCNLRDKAGWYTSKKCRYESPVPEEICSWGTDQYFGIEDIWR